MNSNSLLRAAIAAAMSFGTALTAVPAFGEEALEEIIVTARKRSETLQSVPIAVTALTAETIAQAGLTRLEDITNLVPNMTSQENISNKATNLTLRGISSSGGLGNDPGIGVYVDEVYVSRESGFNLDLLDIQQVEVLKGPQGTLYGRNSVVGAINITTRKPGREFEGQVLADIGDYDQQRYGVLLSGPLGEQLAGKISVVHNERDGFLDNTYGGTVNTVDYDTGRAQLLWNANDDLEFLLTGNYRKDESDGNNLVTRDQWLPLDKDYEVSIPDPGFEDVEASGGSLRITYDWCDYLLTSITSADKIDEDYQNDQDWSPLEALTGFDTRNSEQWSQELRIASPGDGRLTWVGGLYFFHQEFDATQEAVNGPDTIFAAIGLTSLIGTGTLPSDVLPFLPDYVPIKADSTIEVDSYAAYANADYAFSEQWSLSAGLRYSDDRKDLDYVQTTHPLAVAVGFLPIDLEDEVDDDEWTPTVSLNWHPAEDVLAYVKYSRGYKAGGFNNSVSTSASSVAFEAETMDAYELGLKSQWLDQRLQLNAAVFHMEYDDKQESAFVAGAGYRQTNAGKALSDGFEMELQFAATSDWLIYGAVGYADSEYDEYVVDATTDYGGNTLTRAPEWTFNMGTQAEWEFTDYLRGSFRLDYSYQDEFFTQADNDPFFAGDSQNLVNARLGVSDAGKNWEATLWGRNLTDDDNINTIDGPSTFFFETYHYSLIAPRTYGVELKYNF